MRTIHTHFVGPTNSRGARIVAQVGDWKRGEPGRVTVSYDYAGTNESRHDAAASALCDKMGWGVTSPSREFVRGGTAGGYVYVFACDDKVTL